MWTTEKETLFIAEKSAWFGKEVPDIFQVIDVSSKSINNVIEFTEDDIPDGVFYVTGSLQVLAYYWLHLTGYLLENRTIYCR